MNCYTDKYNTSFYCLNPIIKDVDYKIEYHDDMRCLVYNGIINPIHRIDGPAEVEEYGSFKYWFYMGKLHRDDGPAAFENKDRFWYHHGKKHREDGPAIEYYVNDSGPLKRAWYYHDQYINCNSQEEFEKIISMKAFI